MPKIDSILLIKLKFSLNIVIILSLVVKSNQINQGDRLPLKAYQELSYGNFKFETIQNPQHRINKRQISLIDKPFLQTNRLNFRAFDRKFDILLKKDTFLIADNLDIEIRYSNKKSEHLNDFFSSNYYTGIVEDENDSYVVLYFENNSTDSNEPLIFGQIHIKNDNINTIYYIEPLINIQTNFSLKYIIYKSEDVQSDVISNNIFNQTVCRPKYAENFLKSFNNQSFDSIKSTFSISSDNKNKKINKRQSTGTIEEKKTRKNRCHLAVVADYRFFKEIGNSNIKLTSAYMMNIIAAVNSIFSRTVWNLGDEVTDPELLTNFGFSIEKVIVHSESNPIGSQHYNSKDSSTSADQILELFGEEDWSSYCLAHLFTFQSFDNSVLGLAYVSSPLSFTIGGICSSTTRSKKSGQSSVNTGLSSYKSVSQKQGRLLQREAELVTAHELGHNWGSEHDPLKPECSPSSNSGGNFIMYAYSNQGHERNNYLFSPCSINSISEVLKSKSSCFKGESLSYCGNDRIEEGEECDAGLKGRQGIDSCCDFNCRLRPNAQCSDNNHYCCKDCKIAPKNYKCYSSPNYIECFEDHSLCDGLTKDCPSQLPKRENTPCYSFDQGKCNPTGQCLSLCQQQDTSFSQCKCPKSEEKCMICCRNVISNTSNECRPINQIFPRFTQTPIYLSNGRACFDGLCENKVCQQKVKDYVSRFWKVIQKVTVSGFVEFMRRNIVGSIIVISLAIWIPISCCIHFCFDKREMANFKRQILEAQQNRMVEIPIEKEYYEESYDPDEIQEFNYENENENEAETELQIHFEKSFKDCL